MEIEIADSARHYCREILYQAVPVRLPAAKLHLK